MNVRRLVVCSVAAAALSLGLGASTAHAQQARMAVVNVNKVMGDMQETKDLQAKLEQESAKNNAEAKTRLQKVKDLQAARDLLNADSPQYQQSDQAFMQEAIQFDIWQKITQATMQGNQKKETKALFDKILGSTTEVAQQQGIDLVLADQRTQLPDNLASIPVEQVRAILSSRNVLHANPTVDISDKVIENLNAKYKASGGGVGGATAPSPAGGAAAPAPAGGAAAPAPAPAPAPARK